MKKPTLLILAAGMASRYGSMKQTDGFGPNGETIIDYSIFDAIRAGFGKVAFIIREEFAPRFKEIFEPKLQGLIETDYIYQDFDLSKFGIDTIIPREKPWGTAHAVLSAKGRINEPFCVINADDFYGFDAFEKMADFLNNKVSDNLFSLVGFEIDKTLSDYGSVSRGVCVINEKGFMTGVHERTKVYYRTVDGEKQIVYKENGVEHLLALNSRVSMNFWGFNPIIFEESEKLFREFVAQNVDNPKAEFFIPIVADHLIQSGKVEFEVLPTSGKWFGVTYKEDKPIVEKSLAQLVADGVYPEKLF